MIGAVISIISKQKKKKRLQQQLQQNSNQQEPEQNSRERLMEHPGAREPTSPTESVQDGIQGFIQNRFPQSDQSLPEEPKQTVAKKRSPTANILQDVAREFGIIVDEPTETQPPKFVAEEPSRSTLNIGENSKKSFSQSTSRFEEETVEVENQESEYSNNPISLYESSKKIMGPAMRGPQVSPSLAVSLNSSKTHLLDQLRDPSSFKKAFILKTILDKPVSLKNKITR